MELFSKPNSLSMSWQEVLKQNFPTGSLILLKQAVKNNTK